MEHVPGCKLKTRTVEIAGITNQPDESWMTQIAQNLTNPHNGFLRDVHYLILDRDLLYTATSKIYYGTVA